MNVLEIINEIFVLITGYFLFNFTDLIPDVEVRYIIGKNYMILLFSAISIDALMIFIIIARDVYHKIRLWRLKKKILKIFKMEIEKKRL